jgi:hypothetical protein
MTAGSDRKVSKSDYVLHSSVGFKKNHGIGAEVQNRSPAIHRFPEIFAGTPPIS